MKHILLPLLVLLACIEEPTRAQISWQPAFPNLPTFNYPLELVHAADGTNRLFLVQQRGIIYVFQNSATVSTRKVFLDISDRVSQSGSETGLLGLAFHPAYNSNGYFYVNYTGGGSLTSFIARYQVSATNPDSAVKASEQILITIPQPYSNHNGGKVAFGPDGLLYIGFGDGGLGNDPGNRAQNRSELLGKILRIDVDRTEGGNNYAIPTTNPFYGNTQGWRQEIFAYGVRNPWKFSFDSQTGTLWLGDVGQDAREEIDIVVNGGNYGWRLMEGSICNPTVNPSCLDTAGLIRPVWDYPNAGADASITGGYVYRSTTVPSLTGKYIYSDYSSGKTWALTYDGINPPTNQLLTDETFLISTFCVDQFNELYLCSYGATSGRIYKLTGPANGVASNETPIEFKLEQNYPNPFNPTTSISFILGHSTLASLKVFDVLGKEVATLVDGFLAAGEHTRIFDGSRLSSGVYYYRMRAGGFIDTKTMIVVK